MKILAFDVKGKIAHFRRPDTTITHASYPLITRTALWGMIGSILGLERLTGENWVGLRLMHKVTTVSQELSLLGKGWLGNGKDFNRPTAIELVVSPHYRIFYSGEHLETLAEMLVQGRSHYHTYLGSAFCLTFPRLQEVFAAEELRPPYEREIETYTAVPSHAISRLIPQEGLEFGRVGGLHYEQFGDREFRGTISLIYEVSGQKYAFFPRKESEAGAKPYRFCLPKEKEKGVICLW